MRGRDYSETIVMGHVEVAMVTLVALLGYQFMRTHATWIGNW